MVGLGNPGKEYAETRHNVGRMVVDHWAADAGVTLGRLKSFGSVAKVSLSPPVYVADTAGYMNVSGPPAKQMASFYSIEPSHIVVVHDDLDIPFGTIRLKYGGGHGGHNGLKSLQQAFGTADFFRVRIGIGRPEGRKEAAAFVLERFTTDQRAELPFLLDTAQQAAEAIIVEGLTQAQQRFHQPPQ